MNKAIILFLAILMAIATPVWAETDIEFDPVEKDLMLKESVRERLLMDEEVPERESGKSKWLYLLLGIGVIGAAAAGGGGGGSSPSGDSGTGTVNVSW